MFGLGGIIYGTEGIGKTSLALQFPHPITFISIRESGFNNLEMVGKVPKDCINYQIEEWSQLIHLTQKTERGTVVVDSLTGLQKILFDHVCLTVFGGSYDDFNSFYKGARVDSPQELNKYLDLVDRQRAKGVNFIFLGHAVVEETPNALGANYLSHVVLMDNGPKGGVRSYMTTWAGFIFFLQLSIDITRATEVDRRSKMVMEGKAKEDDNRLIYTTKSAGHSAKNSWDLPPVISMGSSPEEAYKNLWNKMPESYKKSYPI